MDTDELIARLVATSTPVRSLPRPLVRAISWLAISLPYVALVVLIMAPRPDLAERLEDPRYLVEQVAALLTAFGAAGAAFSLTVPGLGRRLTLIPAIALGVWLTSLSGGCVRDWLELGPDGPKLNWDLMCVAAIGVSGTVPAIAIVIMLRRGISFRPGPTLAWAGLAATALGAFAVRLFHLENASLMVLFWQFGAVALFSALIGALGRPLLAGRDWTQGETMNGQTE